ncbi:phage holin family protein [Brevifollis gellanilyticus]|uniref:Phage holin family protein n=1 Tax=Brevifollis gellanilyticus TaxID=748831 RepID=A0A512M3N2_9BACT|nr:phage holin family protein [Brevifollis gellanilyticus]GEP40931.1 hypothetical protein BGE01nite_02220 [Brevifollis gellanilyticus]
MLYHLWGWFEAVLHYLQLRTELALAEAKETGSHYGLIAGLFVAALVVLLFAYVFLILTVVFALAEWMDGEHVWIKIMGGATTLHILLAIALALWAKSRLKEGVFEKTRQEFKKDKLWSKTHHQPEARKI